jgi:hypothetical protein
MKTGRVAVAQDAISAAEAANWGLALLMRPARAASTAPFVNLPLCQRPNICVCNNRGVLARWYHANPPCPFVEQNIFRLDMIAVKVWLKTALILCIRKEGEMVQDYIVQE